MNLEPDRILLPLAGNNQNSLVAQLRVMNDVMPTPQQYADLMNQFTLHRAAVRTSAAGFLTKDGELTDGSRFRIVSNSGMHTVMIWPISPGGSKFRVPHGFAVVTNWHAPFIYKYQTDTEQWAIAPDALPQLTDQTIVDGYNQVAVIDKALVYPALRNQKKLQLWDFGPHAAPHADGKTYVVPANLTFPDAVGNLQFKPLLVHFMMDYAVNGAGGAPIYAVTPPPAILTPPEDVTPLPGCTDATGTTMALQLVRKAQTSLTNDLWTFRFCSEALTRSAEKTYSVSARNDVDVLTPVNPNDTVTLDTTTTNNLGVALGADLFLTVFQAVGGASVPDPPFDSHGEPTGTGTILGFYGCARQFTDYSASTSPSDTSLVHTYTKVAAPTNTFDKIVALPAESTVEYARLDCELHYPGTKYFRGGTASWTAAFSLPLGARGLARSKYVSKRIDAKHDINGAPHADLKLGWTTVRVLEGTVTAKLYGAFSQDTETDSRMGGDIVQYTFATPNDKPPNNPGTTPADYYAEWVAEPNFLPGWLSEWNSSPAPQPGAYAGSVSTADIVTTNENTALYCTGSYTYTSRHIIDYDHRSRFYAAIRVEVQCTDARWDQVPSGYQGQLASSTDPSYVVNIYFETNWNGVAAEQLLASDSCTRPAFEFTKLHERNVYYYPGDDTGKPLDYYIPPQLGLQKETIEGLTNLALHQGVNPHLVARMVYQSVPSGMVSVPGIEYTQVNDDGRGNISATMQHAFVDGQLYARTFKLSDADIADALWTLSALMMDAPLNNAYPTDGSAPALWHYMPALGDAINNTTFHIEARNGIIEQWSDNIPADGPHVVRPAAAAREIALYEI